MPKIKNSKKPPKKAEVCHTVSFSSCASINSSSVTRNKSADNPKESARTRTSGDALFKIVAPSTALTKNSMANPMISTIDFFLLILFRPNSEAVAIQSDSSSTARAIDTNIPSALPAEKPIPNSRPSITISTPIPDNKPQGILPAFTTPALFSFPSVSFLIPPLSSCKVQNETPGIATRLALDGNTTTGYHSKYLYQ